MQMLLVFLWNYYKKNKNKNAGRVALLAVGLKTWIASAFFFFFWGGGGGGINGRTSAQIKYFKGCLRLFTLR